MTKCYPSVLFFIAPHIVYSKNKSTDTNIPYAPYSDILKLYVSCRSSLATDQTTFSRQGPNNIKLKTIFNHSSNQREENLQQKHPGSAGVCMWDTSKKVCLTHQQCSDPASPIHYNWAGQTVIALLPLVRQQIQQFLTKFKQITIRKVVEIRIHNIITSDTWYQIPSYFIRWGGECNNFIKEMRCLLPNVLASSWLNIPLLVTDYRQNTLKYNITYCSNELHQTRFPSQNHSWQPPYS